MSGLDPGAHLRRRRWWWLGGVAGVVVVALVVVLVVADRPSSSGPPSSPLPLRPVAEVALPGDSSRFDYASLDSDLGLLFIAHLGASEIIEVDIRTHTVVRTIPNVSQVHGVLVVAALHRVFATATGSNQMVSLDEGTGAELGRSATGNFPDGLAYDPRRGTIWTTNETGGTETVIDAATGAVRGTVAVAPEVGNVVHDPTADQMLVAAQGHNELAAIDPTTLTVTRRLALPRCQADHGLALDPVARLAFLACEGNATLLTVDLGSWQVTDTAPVGQNPDVLAYDQGAQRLYVAAESGTVTVLDLRDRHLRLAGSDHLADGAHVVALNPATHHSYFPVPAGTNGHPTLLEREPTT
ncbi:MAG: YncE family protein [Labedaea sp.]